MEDIIFVHRRSNHAFEFLNAQMGTPALWKTCLRQWLFLTEEDLSNVILTEQDEVLSLTNGLCLLTEVLCGLHSPVVGETEVFGQFRRFVEDQKRIANPLFENAKWCDHLYASVKKLRAERIQSLGSHSYGSLLRKYCRDLKDFSLIGSGHLVEELLPWFSRSGKLQIHCRNQEKGGTILQSCLAEIPHAEVFTLAPSENWNPHLVIAAPIEDSLILEIVKQHAIQLICDLRGEENQLPELLAHKNVKVISLEQFFKDLEEIKENNSRQIAEIKNLIRERTHAYMNRCEHRPYGWDDVCA